MGLSTNMRLRVLCVHGSGFFLFLFFFSLVAPLFEFVYYSLLVILVCALHFWYGYLLFGP